MSVCFDLSLSMDVSTLDQMKEVEVVELEEEEKVVVELVSKEMAEEVTKIQVLVLNTILELRRENAELKKKLAAEGGCKVCDQEMESLEMEFERGKGGKASSGFENLFNNLDSLEFDWDKSVKELIDGMADLPMEKNSDQRKKVAFQEKTSDDQDLVDFEVKIKEKLKFTPKKEKAKNYKTESKLEVKSVEETDAFERMIEKIGKHTKETSEEKIVPLEEEKNETSKKESFSGSLEELDDMVSGMLVEDQDGTLSSCFCGVRIGRSVELRNHIEKTHFTSLAISCNLCSKVFKSRRILSVHVARMHGHEFESQVTSTEEKEKDPENLKNVTDLQKPIDESEAFYDEFVNNENFVYFCDQCDHRTDCDESLKTHKTEEHSKTSENVKRVDTTEELIKESKTEWNCKECGYQSAAKKNLKKHYRNMHYKITDVNVDEFNKIFSKQF